jgi:hypothetical protein
VSLIYGLGFLKDRNVAHMDDSCVRNDKFPMTCFYDLMIENGMAQVRTGTKPPTLSTHNVLLSSYYRYPVIRYPKVQNPKAPQSD